MIFGGSMFTFLIPVLLMPALHTPDFDFELKAAGTNVARNNFYLKYFNAPGNPG